MILTAKGMTRMNNYIVISRNIHDFVINLISFYGYKKYSQLSYSDKQELTGLIIKENIEKDPCGSVEFITESDEIHNIVKNLCSALLVGKRCSVDNLSTSIMNNAISHYDDKMKSIFNFILMELDAEKAA